MTPFRSEHVFEGASREETWTAYFDPGFNALLDERLGFGEREVLERSEEEGVIRCSTRIVPRRNLPRFLTRLGVKKLSYVEHSTLWLREDRMELVVEPNLFADRTTVTGLYALEERGGRLRRTFTGEVDVRVPVIGPKVEAMIVEDVCRSHEIHGELTQAWLDGTVASAENSA